MSAWTVSEETTEVGRLRLVMRVCRFGWYTHVYKGRTKIHMIAPDQNQVRAGIAAILWAREWNQKNEGGAR